MGEEIAIENGGIFDIRWFMALTLDPVLPHTVVTHHSLTSIYMANFIEIEETFFNHTR